jgi:hypothetical protein
MRFDVVLSGGLYFDGTGAPGQVRDVGLREGRVAAVSEAPLDTTGAQVIDARGRWVVPGFVDLHTHYDAELIAAPALSESVRHGVTTVAVGSCSISTILSEPEDCSDLFTRVESVPRAQVLPLLRARKTWRTPAEYVTFLRAQPLGANVCAFLGHSDLRTRVLGLGRAVDGRVRPTEAELAEMERWLGEAIDVGLLGLSSMTNPWDKLDGDRYRSRALPSAYASWGEYRRLNRLLRARGAILQSAPNLVTAVNSLLFLAESAGLRLRKALKTTLITLADAKASPGLHRVVSFMTRVCNRLLGGDLRWQTLPVPFEVYADGMELVVFEEFGAGREALHLADQLARNTLMQDEAYRRRFRRDYEVKLSPRVWNRDFYQAEIVGCPDASVVGQTFGQVAGRARPAPGRRVPRSDGGPRRAAALAHDHRQPPATRGGPHDRRPRRAGGLRRLGRAHPQHGLLQLPAAHAAARGRAPDDAARARRVAADGRAGRLAGRGGRPPAGGRSRRPRGHRPDRSRRAARRLPRGADGGPLGPGADGEPLRRRGRVGPDPRACGQSARRDRAVAGARAGLRTVLARAHGAAGGGRSTLEPDRVRRRSA